MITIHHLGVSQSDRVVWLMEELGLPYQLKWYHRKADRLAPDDFLALHPAASAPIIEDGGRCCSSRAPFGGRVIDDLPNVGAYVKRIAARPAYVMAMSIAGPKATPPKA
jgi:glutathione S-transferase